MTFRVAPLTIMALAVLVTLDVWLLSAVVQDSAPEEGVSDITSQWTPGSAPTTATALFSKPISVYSETLARPVFFKTRQPFVPPPPTPPPAPKVQPAPPPAVVDPGFVLGGVMIDADVKKAYVFSKTNSQGLWLSEGENVMGWTLRAIDPAGAKLQQGGRTIELHLYPSSSRQ